MINKRLFLVFFILLIVLTGLFLITGCTNSNSNLSKSECLESQSDLSVTPLISPSSDNNDINDSSFTVYEGDLQSVILSLEDNHNMINEEQSNDISGAFVNEDGHLFIELSDHSIIDVGLVRETNNNHSVESGKQYTVSYYDYDGVLICSKQVNEGEMAIAPKNPVRDGYSFVGWDRSFISVNTDLEVTAQYELLPSMPQIIVNNAAAFSDTSTIEVKLAVENNPGILGITLQLDYDSRYFSVIKAENGAALNMLSFTKPGRFESPCKFSWDGIGNHPQCLFEYNSVVYMKKRNMIITIVAVIVVICIVAAILVINSRYKISGINPANPATNINASFSDRGTLTVGSATASPGEDIEIAVSIKDNPGILGMTLSVNYITGALTLTDAKNGDALSGVLTFTKPGKYQNNCRFLWDGMELSEDQIKDGDVLILTFHINDDAEPGEYPIHVTYGQDEIVDKNLNMIDLEIIDGSITVE